jgi:quercetin dioxygenase-like cupin family protein
MATQDFEVQQLLKAYRKGIISDELFEAQMSELGAASNGAGGLDVANVFDFKDKPVQKLQETPQSQSVVFNLPANYSNDSENSHKGDQIIYAIDGCVTARVSGQEQDLKAGDVLMIPAGAPHTLRTGSDPFFGLTVLAPPEL